MTTVNYDSCTFTNTVTLLVFPMSPEQQYSRRNSTIDLKKKNYRHDLYFENALNPPCHLPGLEYIFYISLSKIKIIRDDYS